MSAAKANFVKKKHKKKMSSEKRIFKKIIVFMTKTNL